MTFSLAVLAEETDETFPGDAYTQVIQEFPAKGEAETAGGELFCAPPSTRGKTITSGIYYIKNSATNSYLTTTGGGFASGTNVVVAQLASGTSRDSQKWEIIYYAQTGFYLLRPLSSGYNRSHLDVAGSYSSSPSSNSYLFDGTNVQMYNVGASDTSYNSSEWAISSAGDGTYRFMEKMSYIQDGSLYDTSYNKYLAVDNLPLDGNTNVSQHNLDNSKTKWVLTKVSDEYTQMNWGYPINNGGNYTRITTDFRYNHYGIDITNNSNSAPIQGQNLISPASGTVIKRDLEPNAAGYYIFIKTNNIDPRTGTNLIVGFFHMQSMSPLVAGQTVSKGTVIGQAGNSGVSSGPHLHFLVTNNNSSYWGSVQSGKLNPKRFYPNTDFYIKFGV